MLINLDLHCKSIMRNKTISLRVSEDEFDDIESLTKSEGYASKTELVRDLLRKKWEEWGERVLKNFKEHPEEYVSLDEFEKRMKNVHR